MTTASLSHRSLSACFSLTVALGLSGSSLAGENRDQDEVLVKPITFPAPFFEFEKAEPSGAPGPLDRVLEASGVEPIGDGRLVLIAHDKKVPLRVIDIADGRPVGPPLLSPKFPAETPKSSKWEGLARDSDGAFYVIGSHSGKNADERLQHVKLFRFRLNEAAQAGADGRPGAPTINDDSVASLRIDAGLVAAMKAQGLAPAAVDKRKIEGLAIRETQTSAGASKRELVVGLRLPDDKVRAFAADLSATPAENAELPTSLLFAFEQGSREGVRSQLTALEYLPAWKGFLVVTATEGKGNSFHGNTLWFVSDDRIAAAHGAPLQAEQLWVFEVAMKAEGVCVLPSPHADDADARPIRVLIVFDNDAHSTRMPSRFQIVELTRPSRLASRP